MDEQTSDAAVLERLAKQTGMTTVNLLRFLTGGCYGIDEDNQSITRYSVEFYWPYAYDSRSNEEPYFITHGMYSCNFSGIKRSFSDIGKTIWWSKREAEKVRQARQSSFIHLAVVPSHHSSESGAKGEGSYALVLPQYPQLFIFTHFCTNSSYAMSDLRYAERKQDLDDLFGVGEWNFKFVPLEPDSGFGYDSAMADLDERNAKKFDKGQIEQLRLKDYTGYGCPDIL